MLSRVASNLYWMSRYLERAENMSRILDVGQSLAMLSGHRGNDQSANELLVCTDSVEAFGLDTRDGRQTSIEEVARFLAWDKNHPSSIVNCLEASRENARAVRGAITSEMWESINDTWLQMRNHRRNRGEPIDTGFFEWVKERSHLFRGITDATARRDQPYHFIRLGTFLERADNTARILSVKYSGMSLDEDADAVANYYRLSSVLRSVSALDAYRDTYRDTIDERRVAQLLIFDPVLPRSLRCCLDEVERILTFLPDQSGRKVRRLTATIDARLAYGDVDEVFESGLDRFLEQFLRDSNALGDAVHAAYLEMK